MTTFKIDKESLQFLEELVQQHAENYAATMGVLSRSVGKVAHSLGLDAVTATGAAPTSFELLSDAITSSNFGDGNGLGSAVNDQGSAVAMAIEHVADALIRVAEALEAK